MVLLIESLIRFYKLAHASYDEKIINWPCPTKSKPKDSYFLEFRLAMFPILFLF